MEYTKENYADVESKAGLRLLRDALDCERLGVSVIDVDDGRKGPAHDHAGEGQEEVYVLMEGRATITVEDDSVSVEPGDAVRVAPAATRQVELHGDCLMVVAGAP